MKTSTLQSLISRQRNEISLHEQLYTRIKEHARLADTKDESQYLYGQAKAVRKYITKLAATQKELKKEMQFNISSDNYYAVVESNFKDLLDQFARTNPRNLLGLIPAFISKRFH